MGSVRLIRWDRLLVDDFMVGVSCDVVVVPTGPQGPGVAPVIFCGPQPNSCPEFNATLDRLLEGYELASRWDSLLLITGFPGEARLIMNDMEEVKRRLAHLPEPRWQISPCGAKHTAGNASEVLLYLCKQFRYRSADDLSRIRVAVVSHDWHLPRVEMLFRGTLAIFQRYLPELQVEFLFQTAPSHLDAQFEHAFAKDEPRKLRNDRARLGRWRRRLLVDAPTLFKFVVRPGNAEQLNAGA